MTDKKQAKLPQRRVRLKMRENKKNKPIAEERKPKKIGYMRVSTEKQDHSLQYDSLVSYSVKPENIFQDTISGSKINRSGLDKCLKSLVRGDVLVVWKIDRLGRRLYDLVDLMRKLDNMGVGFVSITQNIDTTTPQGRMMLQMLFVFAEFEREMIRERVKAGIQAARSTSPEMKWGRKRSVECDEDEILNLLMDHSIRDVSRITGVPKSTIHLIKKRNQK